MYCLVNCRDFLFHSPVPPPPPKILRFGNRSHFKISSTFQVFECLFGLDSKLSPRSCSKFNPLPKKLIVKERKKDNNITKWDIYMLFNYNIPRTKFMSLEARRDNKGEGKSCKMNIIKHSENFLSVFGDRICEYLS